MAKWDSFTPEAESGIQDITGSVSVNNVVSITGSVEVLNDNVIDVVVTGGITASIPAGVDVNNFPATQSVDITNSSLSVTGDFYPVTQSVFIGNETLEVTGTVDLAGGSIQVSNFPVTQSVYVGSQPIEVSGTFYPSTQEITGTVEVNNFPDTQTIDGTVSVDNFPSVQEITGTVDLAGGAIEVSNFPVTQSIFVPPANTSTRTNLTASTNSVEILTANPNRRSVLFYLEAPDDDSSSNCYIAFGSGPASSNDWSIKLWADDSYEMPNWFCTSPIHAVFNVVTSSVTLYVTENN